MRNTTLLILILVVIIVIFAYFYKKRRHSRKHPQYVALLRDDLYFYPPRFPIPRPQLRTHEVPHRRHFRHT